MYPHEKLDIVVSSRHLIKDVYSYTSKFPSSEKHGLIPQMRRASISILSNTVEGLSRRSKKEKLRFIELAYGSALELDTQTIVAFDLDFIDDQHYNLMRNQIQKTVKLLSGLRRSYLSHIR